MKNSISTPINDYREELKRLLNINDLELDNMFKSTLYSFKKQLEKITGENFIDSLMKLDYNKLVIFNKDEDILNDIVYEHDIYEKNINEKKNCFVCLCGKTHLKNLHLFSHSKLEENQFVIGSSCIIQVSKLQNAYKDNISLCQKLQDFVNDLTTAERLNAYKSCYKCGERCIRKDTNYKLEHMHNYCRSCLLGKSNNFIKCSDCDDKVILASQPLPHDKNKFKEICGKCWHYQNKNKGWYKKKYNI